MLIDGKKAKALADKAGAVRFPVLMELLTSLSQD